MRHSTCRATHRDTNSDGSNTGLFEEELGVVHEASSDSFPIRSKRGSDLV
jgi:hypothetical protein